MGGGAEGEGDVAITIEDVVLAVKVIRKFLEAQAEVQKILRQVAPVTSTNPQYELVKELLLAQRGVSRREEEEEEDVELTPEELERLKKVAKEIK
jgi:uncharacterized protein (DUF2384 family)